jgi:sugar lactone lactonase YvrE
VWCTREHTLYWVDIRKPAVHRYDPAKRDVTTWAMPGLVGSLAIRDKGGVLVALQGRLAVLDPGSSKVEPLVSVEPDLPDNASGALYRFDAKRRLSRMIDGVDIPNSLAWSPDARTMYFADTFRRQIYAYDFDVDSGELGSWRIFAEFAEGGGSPDGSTVDADGFLWTAIYRGAALHRYAPDGRLDRVVPLPMSQPTSCAFGGDALDVLYVTSASQNMTPETLAREPYAGAIIAIDVRTRGIAEPRFAG